MNRRLRLVSPFVVFTAFLLALFAIAGSAGAEGSVSLELVGTFVSEGTVGAYTLDYEGAERFFAIKDVHMLEGIIPGRETGWDVLDEIGRRRIFLSGEKSLVQPLMAGAPSETFTIEGTLYVPDGKFVVETVRKEGKEAQGS